MEIRMRILGWRSGCGYSDGDPDADIRMEIRMRIFGSSGVAPALWLDQVGLDVCAELELGRAVGGNEVDEWNKDRERMSW